MYIQANNYQGFYGKITTSKKEYNNQKSEFLLEKTENIATKEMESTKINAKISIQDAYNLMKKNNKILDNSNLFSQARGTLARIDNDRYTVECSDEIEGCWRIYDKKFDDTLVFDPTNTNIQTDEKTGKKYVISTYCGELMDVMFADNELIDTLEQFLHTEDIATSSLNKEYVVNTDAYTGIECLKIKGNEGKASWVMITDEEQKEKLSELANIYKKQYPDIVQSDREALAWANAEVAGMSVRTQNGIISIACNAMRYTDASIPSKSWCIMYSINDTDMYMKIMNAISQSYIDGMDVEDFSEWEKYFEENKITHEKMFS